VFVLNFDTWQVSSVEEQQKAEMNKIFQSYVVRGTGMDEVQVPSP
jgi:hypothetical protein